MDSRKYLEKITSAHITRPRYMAWLKAIFDNLCEYGNFAENLRSAYNVDFAVGKQLDNLGALVGASRALPFVSESGEGVLDDDTYRAYIKACIMRNMWDGTNQSLSGLWQSVFPSLQLSYVDNQDMTMEVTVTGDISDNLSEMIQLGLIVPCPMGVHQTYVLNTVAIETANVGVGTGLYEYGEAGIENQA